MTVKLEIHNNIHINNNNNNENADSNNNNSNNCKFDDILKQVGYLGRYQIFHIILLWIMLWSGRIFDNTYMFHSALQKYRCLIPRCDTDETLIFSPAWLSVAIPSRIKTNEPKNCQRFTQLLNTTYSLNDFHQCSQNWFDTNQTEYCSNGYVYETDFVGIIKEFQLYCDDNMWKLTLTGSIFNLGLGVAQCFVGHLADRFGRKKILVLSVFISGMISECKAFFAVDYWSLIIFECLHGMASAGIFFTVYILVLELLGPSQRLLGATITQIVSAWASICLGFISLFTNSWRTMTQIASLPAILVIFYGWLAPESIRWLITKGKFDEANEAIIKMAKCNGATVGCGFYINKDKMCQDKTSDYNSDSKVDCFSNLFKTPTLFVRFITMSFCCLTCIFVTSAINLGSTTVFGYSNYNYIYVISCDIIGILVTQLFANQLGRKVTSCSAFLIAGISCIAFAFLPDGFWLKISCYFIGKCLIVTAFTTDYILLSELFPTRYRQRLMAICSLSGRVGSIFSPQVPFLEKIWKPFPFLLFGVMSLIAGLASLTLPETFGSTLPNSIEEAVNIGKVKQTQKNG